MKHQPTTIRTSWAAVALAMLATRAYAGNEDETFVGNDAAMMGGAVLAVVRDGGSTWHNPAGIAGVEKDRLDMSASVYSARWYRAPGFMRSTQGDVSNANIREFVAVPSQISYVRVLTERTKLGLAYYAPRAANLLVRQRMQTNDGAVASDWDVNAVQAYKEYVFGAILGIELRSGFRVGGGMLLRWESLTETVEFAGQVVSGGNTTQLYSKSSLFTHDQAGVEPTLGLQWEVAQNLTLAANARGPRLGLYNTGEDTQSLSLVVADTGAPIILAGTTEEKLKGRIFRIVRLGRYFLGASYRLGPTLLAIDGDLQPGLLDKGAGIERKLAWNVRLGAIHRVGPKVSLGAGVFTDRSADRQNEEGLLTGGANFWGGSLGVRFDENHRLAVGEPADSLRFATIFAIRYAHASGTITSLAVDPAASSLTGLSSLAKTSISVHELALYLGAGLYF